jgi:uncharacterized membrane protein
MAALIFVVTWLIRVPAPGIHGAYLNFGDAVIYMCAYFLGGPPAALAAAIGSGLADLSAGAVVYILPTAVIKGVMGLVAGRINKGRGFAFYALSGLVGGAIMTAGYALFEYAMFGAAYAIAGMIPFNLIQWFGGWAASLILYPAAKRIARHFDFRRLKHLEYD